MVEKFKKQKLSIKMLLTVSGIKNMLCCLIGVLRHRMKRIQSKLRRIETYDVSKISLSCFDEKFYILNNGVSSLALFHEHVLG